MSAPDRPTASRRALVLGTGAMLGTAACSPGSGSQPPATSAVTSRESAPTSGVSPSVPASASPTAVGPPSVALTTGPDIAHGPAGREEVALTFHGQGSAATTDAVRAACREATAAVTVFAVGTWVHADPALVTALQRDGHELGNHTWSHQQMPQLGASTARSEVAKGRNALTAAVGSAGWWFRPSGTRHSTPTIRAAALAAGYHRCISYDVDPEDYLDPGARAVRTRVRRAVGAGSIVSLHLGHVGTAEALPGILSDLTRIGLAPVTLSRLLRD